ncbi:uncharacterized protein LOC110461178 [Mizuhopecten yessoensis]|uniref:uncharacterized protein LOC110461178 n=1 Tax=Mizuhopecten yessoensis TaxID=6573 RepID=UPI000B45D078|nr:uncharacterized protein LOC110461178 [Mizuhopecten yessoensis]
MLQMNLMLVPEVAMLDFEVAARNEINAMFPLTTVKACFFHYTQCIWRKTQGCWLAARYKQDDELRKLVRRAAVLPLFPTRQVEDVWFNALDDNEDNSPEVTRFKDYVTETWVEGQQLDLRNHYDNTGPRTTNHVEGWYSKVNRMCKHAHPNIYAIVKLLQKLQAAFEVRMIQLSAGGKPRPGKKKYGRLDERLTQLKDRFRNGHINMNTYADSASHLLHLD